MRRLATITAITLALTFAGAGIALANGGGGGNGGNGGNGNGGSNPNQPSNPPCDSDSHEIKLPLGLMDKCVNGDFVHLCPDSSPNSGGEQPCGKAKGDDDNGDDHGNGNGDDHGNGHHDDDDDSGDGGGGGGGGTPPPPEATPTCATNGLLDGTGFPGLTDPGTLLNSDKNEEGPLSGPLHTQLEPAIDGLAPVVHEVNCDVVVTLGA